jgi:hypothetical protein
MPIATNDQGQALRLDQSGQWVPTKLATNPQTGERLALDGDQWVSLPKPQVSTATDVARVLPGGVTKGVTGVLGLPGTIQNAISSGFDYLANKATGANINTADSPLSGAKLDQVVSQPFGGFYEPKTTLGRYAETVASFAPAAIGGEASLANRALGRVLAPAVASETAGEIPGVKGTGAEPYARVLGGILGGAPAGAAAGARAAGERLAPRLAEPLPAADAALVQQYEQMGGHLRPGQYNPSSFVRQGDAVLADTPWPRVAGFAPDSETAVLPSQQADEFNRLLSKTFGEDSPRITDDVLQRASKRISDIYETVLPRNTVVSDPPLIDSLSAVEKNVAQAAPAMNAPDVVRIQNVLESIRRQVTDGSIPGKTYQTFRQRGGILDELASSTSPVLQRAGVDIRNALDDAFIRQADPYDAAALNMAKSQFRNLETLRPLAAKAPAGNISPGLVLGAVNREFGSPAAAGDLGTLARVGSAFLKSQPSSGTSERSVWRSLVNKPFSEGVPAIANSAVSLPISAVASRQLNRVINSPQMRARLLANALQNPGATAVTGQAPVNLLARALQQ